MIRPWKSHSSSSFSSSARSRSSQDATRGSTTRDRRRRYLRMTSRLPATVASAVGRARHDLDSSRSARRRCRARASPGSCRAAAARRAAPRRRGRRRARRRRAGGWGRRRLGSVPRDSRRRRAAPAALDPAARRRLAIPARRGQSSSFIGTPSRAATVGTSDALDDDREEHDHEHDPVDLGGVVGRHRRRRATRAGSARLP